MSEQQTFIGKIIELHRSSKKTLEEQCKEITIRDHSLDLPSYCKTYEEFIRMELTDKYVIVKDRVFKILSLEEMPREEYYCVMKKNNYDHYNFICSFYNQATDLTEMLEEEMEKWVK